MACATTSIRVVCSSCSQPYVCAWRHCRQQSHWLGALLKHARMHNCRRVIRVVCSSCSQPCVYAWRHCRQQSHWLGALLEHARMHNCRCIMCGQSIPVLALGTDHSNCTKVHPLCAQCVVASAAQPPCLGDSHAPWCHHVCVAPRGPWRATQGCHAQGNNVLRGMMCSGERCAPTPGSGAMHSPVFTLWRPVRQQVHSL